MSDGAILLYDRDTGELSAEQVFERAQMDYYYGDPVGRLVEQWLISRPAVSRLYGLLRSRPSKAAAQIEAFVSSYGIDTEEILKPLSEFSTFQDFFVRELKPDARPLPADADALISVADARLLAYPLKGDRLIPVKGRAYTLFELLRNRPLAEQFADGVCLIYRLAPVDYHRFCYLDDGSHGPHVKLGRRLHSVNPLSLATGLAVFSENRREYTLLHTHRFGSVLHLDVGALLVGRIVQRHSGGGAFVRGEEKGYFELGGSTIVQLFEPGRIQVDADILDYAARGIETRVRYRMAIGKAL